ncbi:MAG: hypothetical protein LBC98_04560, partial [Prevotellaceae bacterium]|nr:hypothetical protein [Prevotellaceae bacterium]
MNKNPEKLFKRFILSLAYVMTSYFVAGWLIFYVNSFTKHFFLVSATVHLVGLTILFTIPVAYIKKALNIYFIYILVSLYPITVIEIMNYANTSLFWWISTPTVLYAVHFGKKGVRMLWICVLLMISVCI